MRSISIELHGKPEFTKSIFVALAMKDPKLSAIMAISALTGLRIHDMGRLTSNEIDFDHSLVFPPKILTALQAFEDDRCIALPISQAVGPLLRRLVDSVDSGNHLFDPIAVSRRWSEFRSSKDIGKLPSASFRRLFEATAHDAGHNRSIIEAALWMQPRLVEKIFLPRSHPRFVQILTQLFADVGSRLSHIADAALPSAPN